MAYTKKNDTYDKVYYRATTRSGEVIDLTGATVTFKMESKRGQLLVNAPGTVINATNGEMEYQFVAGDTLTDGVHRAEFLVIFPNGKQKTFPEDDYIQVKITKDINSNRDTEFIERVAIEVTLIEDFKEEINGKVTTFEEAVTKVDNIQSQVNQLVIEGDSSVEAAQARVNNSGHSYPTLKTRLDTSDELLAQTAKKFTSYLIELNRWNIKNDGTNANNTTNGINNAISWAIQEGYKECILPKGTYLIDKDSNILISDITGLTLHFNGCKIIKETNNHESYSILTIDNSTNIKIFGGVFQGDRLTHDYSSGGTHEHGHGIKITNNSHNVLIEGVEVYNMTGDSAITTYKWNWINTHNTDTTCEVGRINDSGSKVSDANFIRTINPIPITHQTIQRLGYFGLYGGSYGGYNGFLSRFYDVYFYSDTDVFLGFRKNMRLYDRVYFPLGATKMHLVFRQSSINGAKIEIRAMEYPTYITFKKCNFHDNRRQGISIEGKFITVDDCNIYNIGGTTQQTGTDPQGGIDIEDGYELNQNCIINNCRFWNNNGYHLVIVRSVNTTVRDCTFLGRPSKYYGLSSNGENTSVENCTFYSTNIGLHSIDSIRGGIISNSSVDLYGSNNCLEYVKIFDSRLRIRPSVDYGVKIRNCEIENSHDKKYVILATFLIEGKPFIMEGTTIKGNEPSFSFQITSEYVGKSIFNSNKYINLPNSDLPSGFYENCTFLASSTTVFNFKRNKDVKFTDCYFELGGGLEIQASDVVILKGNTFRYNVSLSFTRYALSIKSVNFIEVKNNTIIALNNTASNFNLIETAGGNNGRVIIEDNTLLSNTACVGINTSSNGSTPAIVRNNKTQNCTISTKSGDIVDLNINI